MTIWRRGACAASLDCALLFRQARLSHAGRPCVGDLRPRKAASETDQVSGLKTGFELQEPPGDQSRFNVAAGERQRLVDKAAFDAMEIRYGAGAPTA